MVASTPDFDGLPCLETLVIRYCGKLEEIHPSLGNRRSLEYRLPHLKVLQLCYMENLLSTPDFNGLPYLQKLEISNCDKLKEIHPSLGNHTSLEYVSVRSCEKLRIFPLMVQMKNLKTLEIVNCYSILDLPKIQSNMENVVSLCINGIRKKFLPSSVGVRHTLLEKVFHEFTRKINLGSLQKLDLSCWGLKDGEIPSGIGELSNLEELDLSDNDFSRLGFSLSKLTRLKILLLSECKWLVEWPELPSRIAVLKADYCESLITIGNNRHTNFKCLCEVSFLRISRGIGNAAGRFFVESMLQCTRKMNPSSLQKLDLCCWGLKDGEIPSVIGELSNLEELDLSDNDFSLLGFSLSKLTRLKILLLSECKWLVELPELPSSIAVLKADNCESLITIGNNRHTNFKCLCEVSFKRRSRGIRNDAAVFFVETMLQCTRKMNPSSLQKLDLSSWGLKDGEIPSGIGELSNLEELDLSDNDFSLLGFSLSKLTSLKILLLSKCKWLVELPELPSSIGVLRADYCESLITIGNNCHTNFKCLCEVSFLRDSRGIVNDAGRLVESMLQGMGIPKALPYIGRWKKCVVQLPENWCYDFCGFIMCAVSSNSYPFSTIINIEKMMNDITSSDREDDVEDSDSEDDVSFLKSIGGKRTWVRFVSFASLVDTSWWEETPNTLLISFANGFSNGVEVGFALVPMGTATDFLAFYTLNILNDSTLSI